MIYFLSARRNVLSKVGHHILGFGRPGIFPPRKSQNLSDFTILVLGPWGEGMSSQTYRFFCAMEKSRQIIKIKIISLKNYSPASLKLERSNFIFSE